MKMTIAVDLGVWGWVGVVFDAECQLFDSFHVICLTGHSKRN